MSTDDYKFLLKKKVIANMSADDNKFLLKKKVIVIMSTDDYKFLMKKKLLQTCLLMVSSANVCRRSQRFITAFRNFKNL